MMCASTLCMYVYKEWSLEREKAKQNNHMKPLQDHHIYMGGPFTA